MNGIEKGNLHSQMFIDKDEKVKISLEEYFRKYPNASFYGLQNGEEAYGSGKISLPILEKVNGKENIDVVIGNGEVVTINLYYMTKMRHSKSEELEYIIEHNIYSRMDLKENLRIQVRELE